MLGTVFTLGILVLAGLFALKLVFGVLGGVLGAFVVLLALAVKIVIVGAVCFLAIRVVSPDTARRLQQKWFDRQW
ncbi:MAG: hypothetical protein NVS4B3_02400 [Gemmatimonadaceae bacterium]